MKKKEKKPLHIMDVILDHTISYLKFAGYDPRVFWLKAYFEIDCNYFDDGARGHIYRMTMYWRHDLRGRVRLKEGSIAAESTIRFLEGNDHTKMIQTIENYIDGFTEETKAQYKLLLAAL